MSEAEKGSESSRSPGGVVRESLRERKKAKTRAAIQRQALRLFREQGYDATTVEQIAEAAEVSPSTFFRYFHTKEEVVLWDEFDPLLIGAFQDQPPGLGPLQALKKAIDCVFTGLSPSEMKEQRQRLALIVAVPELRKASLEQFSDSVQAISELVAQRLGRRPDEFAVRNFAGALMGVMMSALLSLGSDPQADIIELINRGIEHLEAGLPL